MKGKRTVDTETIKLSTLPLLEKRRGGLEEMRKIRYRGQEKSEERRKDDERMKGLGGIRR